MVTSAKVKAQRPQSREGAEPSTAPLFCSMVPDGAGVMVMPPQHPQGCWEERPQLLYKQAAGMAGQAHGKAGEPGATRRPGRAAAPCRVRQQAGYPSTKCPIQHQLWDCFAPGQFFCQALCSELPHQLGRGALGALQRWVALGKSSGPWERKERSRGTGWRRSRAPSHMPTQPYLLQPGTGSRAQGLPGHGNWLSMASSAPHHCWAKTGAFGAACLLARQGRAQLFMDLREASLALRPQE